jgi:hypothetical protein
LCALRAHFYLNPLQLSSGVRPPHRSFASEATRINDPKYLGSPRDVVRGFRVGALFGAFFGVRAAIGAARAAEYSPGNPWIIGAVVLIGGCIAGAIIGAFRPLAQRLPVALLLGFAAVFPVLVALDLVRSQVTYPPADIRWGVDALSALILGMLGVFAIRVAKPSDRAA